MSLLVASPVAASDSHVDLRLSYLVKAEVTDLLTFGPVQTMVAPSASGATFLFSGTF